MELRKKKINPRRIHDRAASGIADLAYRQDVEHFEDGVKYQQTIPEKKTLSHALP